jgi:toxin-antitoxin system, toxin component, bro family
MTLLKNTKEVVDFKLKLVLAFRNLKNIFSERMPKTLPEALRMYAEQLEKTEQLVLENKELERTKAWINNKKTATAMNTASRYAKINKELKIKLDNSKEYATVKRMELLYH